MVKVARASRAIAEYVTHTFPGMSRVLLGLSAQGYLPRSVYRRFPKSITKPLFHEGMRLYSAPYGLYAPLEAVKQWTDFEPVSQKTFKDAVKAGMTVLDVGANAGYYTFSPENLWDRRATCMLSSLRKNNLAS